MITDRRKLLDFRWKRAGIIHANQVCLCSQSIDHLVVRLANAYDPLLRAPGRLLILKASAAGHQMHENKNGDYLSANHKATNVLQNTRTSHLLHLIVAKGVGSFFFARCPIAQWPPATSVAQPPLRSWPMHPGPGAQSPLQENANNATATPWPHLSSRRAGTPRRHFRRQSLHTERVYCWNAQSKRPSARDRAARYWSCQWRERQIRVPEWHRQSAWIPMENLS